MARVLLIAPTCDGHDVSEPWLSFQWATRLAARHDLTVLTFHKKGRIPASEQLSGARVVEWTDIPIFGRFERFNSMVLPGYLPFYFRARRWIKEALARGEHFEVAHQPVPVAMRYPSPAAGLGIPLVLGPVGGSLSDPVAFSRETDTTAWYVRLRRIDQWRLRRDPFLRHTYETADCVLGIGEYVADNLRDLSVKMLVFVPENGLERLPETVDRTSRSGPVRLLYIGRLVRTKGAREALRAVEMLRDLDVVLDVVGDGPDRGACESLADDLGLEGRVTFHGTRSREELQEFYRRADIFVFPSFRETGGSVVIEAMGAGLPVVVADRGGPASTTDSGCAFRVPVTTPDDLARGVAEAVRELACNPGLRAALGSAGRERARRTALWEGKVELVEEVYEVVARDAPARGRSKVRSGERTRGLPVRSLRVLRDRTRPASSGDVQVPQ